MIDVLDNYISNLSQVQFYYIKINDHIPTGKTLHTAVEETAKLSPKPEEPC